MNRSDFERGRDFGESLPLAGGRPAPPEPSSTAGSAFALASAFDPDPELLLSLDQGNLPSGQSTILGRPPSRWNRPERVRSLRGGLTGISQPACTVWYCRSSLKLTLGDFSRPTRSPSTARTENRGNLASFCGSSPSWSSWSTALLLLPGLGAREGGFDAGLDVGLEAGRDGGLEPLGGVLDWEAGREI